MNIQDLRLLQEFFWRQQHQKQHLNGCSPIVETSKLKNVIDCHQNILEESFLLRGIFSDIKTTKKCICSSEIPLFQFNYISFIFVFFLIIFDDNSSSFLQHIFTLCITPNCFRCLEHSKFDENSTETIATHLISIFRKMIMKKRRTKK